MPKFNPLSFNILSSWFCHDKYSVKNTKCYVCFYTSFKRSNSPVFIGCVIARAWFLCCVVGPVVGPGGCAAQEWCILWTWGECCRTQLLWLLAVCYIVVDVTPTVKGWVTRIFTHSQFLQMLCVKLTNNNMIRSITYCT